MGKFSDFFTYDTVQIVKIHNARVSCIHIFFQLAIIGYIVGYSLLYKKAYQQSGQVSGSADIKVKGTGYTPPGSVQPWYGPNTTADTGVHIYDSYDLVLPAMEENALFVTTSMWVTKNQRRGICSAYPAYPYTDTKNTCQTDADCIPLKAVPNGIQTGLPGSCRTNYTDPGQLWPVTMGSFCDVYAWCPTELELDNHLNNFTILGVEDFTVFVRMNVNYPLFGIKTDNTRGADKTQNGFNLWTLRDMITQAGFTYNGVKNQGMTIGMNAVWDCDFDHPVDNCKPTVSFQRLDDPTSTLSTGFNFRSIEMFHDEYDSRQLTKHYGVRVLVLISGVGRKFSPVALLTAIGAGIGLLSVATLIADFIATKVLHDKELYKEAKYKDPEQEREQAKEHLNQARQILAEHQCVHCGATDPELAKKVDFMDPDAAASTTAMSNADNAADQSRNRGYSESASSAGGAYMARKPSDGIHMPHRVASPSSNSQLQARSSDDEVEAPWAVAHFPKK